MKKLRDYLPKTGVDFICMSNIDILFANAKTNGIKTLEVSKEEHIMLSRFFIHQLPWNWSGKSIWGIRLVIKEPLKSGTKILLKNLDWKKECDHEWEDSNDTNATFPIICKKCGKIKDEKQYS